MKTLSVGIIGVGGIGRGQHIPGYVEADGAEIAAVADINKKALEQVASEFDIEDTYTDYHKLLARKDIRAVSVCTPNYLHKTVSIAAMKAGKHVLVEKPLARDATEGRAMVAAAKKYRRKLMVAHQTQFDEQYMTLKRLIAAGELGDIYYARVWALRRRGIPGWGIFTNKKLQGGGPMIDIGVHAIYTTLWLMDFPRPVAAAGALYTKFGNRPNVYGRWGQWDWKNYTVEDFAVGFVRFKGGMTMSVESSFAANIGSDARRIVLLGDKGGLDSGGPNGTMFYSEKNKTLLDIKPEISRPRKPAYQYRREVAAFVESVRRNKPVPVPGAKSLLATEVIDGIYKSARLNREVKL